MKIVNMTAPPMKTKTRRTEGWMMAVEPDSSRGYEVPRQTAHAWMMWGRQNGWKMVQKQVGTEASIVWRIA